MQVLLDAVTVGDMQVDAAYAAFFAVARNF